MTKDCGAVNRVIQYDYLYKQKRPSKFWTGAVNASKQAL